MYKKVLFKGTHLNGSALLRSQDFTKNTLDIKSSTGIGATTSILNITDHDVIAVFPLKGVIEAKEAKRTSFKSKRQYFIYSKSTDKWSDVIDYFDAYGSSPTNLIICTTAEQILIVREHHPELYLKLISKPLFIDEVHLFTQEFRLALSTFINAVRNEWKGKYKLSTATPIRHFAEIFGGDFDICTLKREDEPKRKLLKTNNVKDAWKYVFSEMASGRQIVIFSNDINHHKKEFIEHKRINLTGDGLRTKLSAFGKGLDHVKEDIDTTFLNTFPLIFCSSKYLTGYDIEPTADTSMLVLTNNKDQSTSYSVEDIIQAYGRVRMNLINALVCVTEINKISDKIELSHLEKDAEQIYSLTKLREATTLKNINFNKKSYNNYPFDLNGYASKLLAYDSFLIAESDYIMYNEFDTFMNGYGFDVEPLQLDLSTEDLEYIKDIQKTKKKLLKSVNIDSQIENIMTGQKGKDIYNTIINLSLNPKTKRNKSGVSCELITLYCIAFFNEYLPAELFQKIKYQKHKRIRGLSNELIVYFNTNYPDKKLRRDAKISMDYDNQLLLNIDYDFEPAINPDHFSEVVRIFRYANHNLNMDFESLGDESQKTIEMFYLIKKYKSKYQKQSKVKEEVLEQLKHHQLNEKDMIRIDKNIAATNYGYPMKWSAFVKMNITQIKDASMYLMSRNQSFVVSYVDGREYNPLTQISTVFRENFLYNYTSIDIVSANAQFTDKILGTKIGLDVYQNLMDKRKLNRSDVKVLFNSTLNNNKLSRQSAHKVYMDSGHTDADAYKLAKLTAGTVKGSYFKLMANAEQKIMSAYNEKYCYHSSALRLHDSLILEDMGLTFPDEHKGVKFKIESF